VVEWQNRPLESMYPVVFFPFFAYSQEIRKIIYTTHAIESLHMQLRKVLKNRAHFPGDEAATKLIYLALRHFVATN